MEKNPIPKFTITFNNDGYDVPQKIEDEVVKDIDKYFKELVPKLRARLKCKCTIVIEYESIKMKRNIFEQK